MRSPMMICAMHALVQNVGHKEMMKNLHRYYALAFEWSTGCSSGIYRFERIWRLGEKQDPDNGKAYVHGAW